MLQPDPLRDWLSRLHHPGRNSSAALRRLPSIVRNSDDVEALLRERPGARHLSRQGIPVDVPGLDAQGRSRLEAELRRFARACGGAAGGAAFLLTAAAWLAWEGHLVLANAWGEALAGTVLVPCATFVAKALAMCQARRCLRRKAAQILVPRRGSAVPLRDSP
jgi:hypothetical protein